MSSRRYVAGTTVVWPGGDGVIELEVGLLLIHLTLLIAALSRRRP